MFQNYITCVSSEDSELDRMSSGWITSPSLSKFGGSYPQGFQTCPFSVGMCSLSRRSTPLAGYTLYDHKTNNSIRKELRITNILDKIDEYRKKWLLHIQRMPQNRIPLKSYNYRPQGRRSIGRPKRSWREQL